MKKVFLCLLFAGIISGVWGQLVRKKDYDAAFALQLGGETGLLTAFHQPEVSLRPVAGVKMTFPFSRKWFLGTEVNYSELKYKMSEQVYPNESELSFSGEQQAEFHLKQLRVPLYLKYMLNCNKASVLFGFYGAYLLEGRLNTSLKGQNGRIEAELDELLDHWHAGITVGYEHRIVKHLNIMCQVNIGVKEIVKKKSLFKDKLLPMQACLTVSYDIFRIGDCGCD